MAGRCLGELVRKMGDRVLQQIIPILQQGMQVGKGCLLGRTAGGKPVTCPGSGSVLAAY